MLIKLLSFNILRNGTGEAGDRREHIAALIRKHDPDILCLQEGGDGAFWDKLAQDYGFRHAQSIPGEFQPALFSKLPVKVVATHNQVKFVYFQIDLGGSSLGVYSTHLLHWPQRDAERVASLHKLLSFARAQEDCMVCIAGDFNSRTRGEEGLSWGVDSIARHNQCAIRPDDWVRATDVMAVEAYIDCYRRLNDTPGYTLHPLSEQLNPEMVADRKKAQQAAGVLGGLSLLPPMVRIDYIFANPALAERLTSCHSDDTELALQASDHLPLVATFAL